VIWTISAALGTGGPAVATELADRAGVRLLDRAALAEVAHDLRPDVRDVEALEARVGGRLNAFALGAALTAGSAEAFHELQLRQTLPDLGRAVLHEASRQSAVILVPGAFAALRDHPSAVHVRLHAPFAWRVDTYARCELVDHACAEKKVKHDDHAKRAWVRTLYHLDIEDMRLFSIALDVSRFSTERLAEIVLASGNG
jgi:cytidylate kinase